MSTVYKEYYFSFIDRVERDPSLQMPDLNAPSDILTAYLKKVGPMVEKYKHKDGSGILVWRCGKVLNVMRGRICG